MDGIRDIGGLDGFGPIASSPAEPVFFDDWERRAFRATFAVFLSGVSGARWRHSIERMDPAHYLGSAYYEHWLTGIATLLVEDGHTSASDLDARAGGRFPLSRPDRAEAPAAEIDHTDAKFAPGDQVSVRSWHPRGHTRAPRYVQGKRGVVVRADEPANLPDLEAHGGGRVLDPTYSVRFAADELWGEGAEEGCVMHVDLWERYLEAVD